MSLSLRPSLGEKVFPVCRVAPKNASLEVGISPAPPPPYFIFYKLECTGGGGGGKVKKKLLC